MNFVKDLLFAMKSAKGEELNELDLEQASVSQRDT